MKNIILTILGFLSFMFISCQKLVEVEAPITSLSSINVYNNDATAIGAVTALYVKLNGYVSAPGPLNSLSVMAGLSADELNYYSLAADATLDAYYRNDLTNLNVGFTDYWSTIYGELFIVNSALEGLSVSTRLTPAIKKQLLGEVKFMRSFYYFYLVNLYGEVPLVVSTDYTVNALIPKSSKDVVYRQILKDLLESEQLLSEKYLKGDGLSVYSDGMEERVRPTKWAASALLARVYLYMENWNDAAIESSKVISNTNQFLLLPENELNHVFFKNNKEAIWQLQPVVRGFNTQDAYFFIIPEGGPSRSNPVSLNNDLIKTFEPGDKRKSEWIKSIEANGIKYYYPFKYTITLSSDPSVLVNEYPIVMRLAEQYLIRAEARAEQDNISGAIEDIDEIRNRAGLVLIKNSNPNIHKEDLLIEILKERQLELFTEWGHRWFDLKRRGKIDEVMTLMTPKKSNGLTWKSFQQNYPISLSELNANPNLTQVKGY